MQQSACHAAQELRVSVFSLVYWKRNDEQEMQRETSILTQQKSRLLIERVPIKKDQRKTVTHEQRDTL